MKHSVQMWVFISIFKFISDHLYYKTTKEFFTYSFPNDNGDQLADTIITII